MVTENINKNLVSLIDKNLYEDINKNLISLIDKNLNDENCQTTSTPKKIR